MAICNKKQSSCFCGIDEEICDGRHMCSDPLCGGSWKDELNDIKVLLIPFRLTWIRQATATYEILREVSWERRREILLKWQMKLDY
ncbi:hypothetical protein SEA_YARA_57 [Streptomyces phage Yara]|nr:hypothetical protein SEA_YARA_57 [Streptomyces phage Yara]